MAKKEIRSAVIAVWALTAVGVSLASQMDVRVRPTDGGPQIFVNGKAVPPRMFWGRSGARTHVAPQDAWNTVELDCATGTDTDRATAHVRFRVADGGAIRLRNFRLLADGREIPSVFPRGFDSEESFRTAWNVWDPGKADFRRTVSNGVCEVAFRLPPVKEQKGKTQYHFYSKYFTMKAGVRYCLRFEVQGYGGSTGILPNVYVVSASGHHDSLVSGPKANTLYSTAAKAAAAGVDFVSYGIPDGIWGENGDDFSAFDAITRQLIAVNPKVRLIPRVSVNAPVWWLRQNPDHRMQMAPKQVKAAQGNRNVWSNTVRPDMAAVSSRLYRRAAVDYISRFCRHMMETFPENFAGIHPTGQNTHEWFYFDSWNKMNGYDPQTLAAFREYVHDPSATVPTEDERMAEAAAHHLLDARTQRRLIAFNRFQQLEMTDFVAELARACRRETQGKKLVVIFYGYAYEFAAHFFGPANSGHYGLENLIRRADGAIDILCSPISYSDRGWPGATPNMSCGETVMRQGILWLNEDDSRTYLDMRGEQNVQEGSLVDAAQSCQVMRRNTSCEAVHGFGSWWMDLPGWGWYDSELLWNEQKKLNPLDEDVCRRRVPFTPEVALIQDEESMIHVRPDSSRINGKLVSGSRRSANRAGVSHGQYLLFDVLERPLTAKLQIFQSCWCLSDADVEALVRQKRENPAWRVWCWAAGAQDEDGNAQPSRMNRLTGFKLEPHDLTADSRLIARATSVGLAQRLVDKRWYGATGGSSLAFKVADAKPEEIWATYPNGDAAIVVRPRPDGKGGDIFLGVPELAVELVHAFARVAGAHTYIDRSTVDKVSVQASAGAFGDPKGGFGMMQAQEDVTFALKLPNRARLTDAISGEELGIGDSVPFTLKKGDVRVFRWQ